MLGGMPSLTPASPRRRLRRALALTAVALAGAPAAAHATALVYVENHNVVVSSPDGQVKQQLTTDGGPDTNYVYPQRDDAGSTVAARHAAETLDATLYRWDARGERTHVNLLPKPGLLMPTLPTQMGLSRDGQHVAYGWSFLDVDLYRHWGVRVVSPEVHTPYPRGADGTMEGYGAPTWFGNRLVVSDTRRIFVQEAEENLPYHWHFSAWLSPADGLRFTRAAIHPDGRSFALEVADDAGERAIGLGRGAPGDPAAQLVCDLPTGSNPADVSFSPDGALIAWRDDDGVKVAGAMNLDTCALSSPPRLISATGTQPQLGGGDPYVAAPVPPAPPRPPAPPGGQPGGGSGGGRRPSRSAAAVTLSAPRARLRAALANGLRVTVRGARRGTTVRLTGRVGRRIVARGSARAGRGGRAVVTLRFTRAARRRLARAGRVTLTVAGGGARLRVKLAGAGPRAVAAAASVSPICARQLRRAPRARSRELPACALGVGGGGPFEDWDGLSGNEYAFEDVQVSGTLTAYEPRDRTEDWSFRARSTTRVSPRVRTEGTILRRRLTEVGGRFTLDRPIVVATMLHVDYRIRGSATYTTSDGRQFDCTFNPPVGITRLGMTLWRPRDRDRVAVRYDIHNGGWACGGDVVFAPTCHGKASGADLALYRPAEFTRRWIKLPIDLAYRTGTGLICGHRFHGYVRLKKLRDGR